MTKPNVKLNVLAKNLENAQKVLEAAEGQAYIGVMVKHFPTKEAAIDTVLEFQNAKIAVSVGMGGGDPAVWNTVLDVSVATRPAHANQIFPAAGYTLGALRSAGSQHTLVNGMITPSGEAGKVLIGSGPTSRKFKDVVSCEAAAAMLAEVGVQSIKFYPIGGTKHLDEVAAMVRAAAEYGIEMFEPTGGIDTDTIGEVVKVCANHGAKLIVPHIYTSIIDQESGLTRIEDIEALIKAIRL